ncbi:MAG: antibiotic biosynthesis monooxygenase [Clostridia bacterium]|nr:antibiotic biosynthesis monooxygenase [Clostridia bacterium]
MIAVIFEVIIPGENMERYLEIAGGIRDELEKAEGFIYNERYKSITNPDKLLSFSLWESEEAVTKWRNQQKHREAQKKGREEMFEDYRIRVTSVIRDYGMTDRDQVPEDSKEVHDR